MRNVYLVIKHEISTTLGKPSFWLTTFVFPLIIFVITFGSQILAQDLTEDQPDGGLIPGLGGPGQETAAQIIGYVDEAGVITQIPEAIPAELLREFASRTAADAGIAAGEIEQYYVLPEEFLDTGEVILVQASFSPFAQLAEDSWFEYVITYNLVEDVDVAVLLLNPMPQVRSESLAVSDESPTPEADGVATSLVSTGMLFIFFFVLTMSSGFMLRSVTQEKENRVMELLLLSLRPRDLMLGKILGLGLVALLQMAIWLGGGLFIVGRGLPIAGLAAGALSQTLPSGFVVWAVLYFLFGYLTFASLLGALGTLAPTMREGSQFTFLVLLPLMIPLWLNSVFIEAPDGTLATALSIFPLTSPVSMVARMTATSVPIWQVLLSLGLLAATTYGLILLSARFFRSDTLLSSAPLDMKRIRQELKRLI